MAERKTRGHVYSIEEAIEKTLSQPRELDIGLSSLTPNGELAEVAEEDFEEILEEARGYEEIPHDAEGFEEDFDENFDEEMAAYLAEHGEETPVVKLPEARPVARRRRTFLSTEGEHVKPKQEGPKAGVKIKEAATSAGGKVKTFFKESVIPLFIETEEVVVQDDEFEDEILDDYDEEENAPSFSDMYASAKNGATGFFDRVGNFFNTKVINPIKEKIIENEEDFEDVEVVSPEERREGLHVIDRRRTVPVDAEYSEIDEEEDFYEEDEEEPGWVQKLLDRFLNPEDDLEEDVYYDEEEDDPSIVDTVREFFHNRKAERAANRTEEVREETKPKSKLADKIRGFFYDEEEVFDEEQVEVVETYPEDEEDYSQYTVPDPEIYEAIIRERNEKTEE